MKICRNLGFTHSQYHPEGITLSTPLEETLQSPRLVPQVLRDEVQVVMKGIWGRQAEEMDIDEYRICWYGYCPFPLKSSLFPLHGVYLSTTANLP